MPRRATSKKEYENIVLQALNERPRSWSELKKITKLPEATLWRVLKDLEGRGIVGREGGKWALVSVSCSDTLRNRYIYPLCEILECDPDQVTKMVVDNVSCEELVRDIKEFKESLNNLADSISQTEPLLSVFIRAVTLNETLTFLVALEFSLPYESIKALKDALRISDLDRKTTARINRLLDNILKSFIAKVNNSWRVLSLLETIGYNGALKLTVFGLKTEIPIRKIAIAQVFKHMEKSSMGDESIVRFIYTAVTIGYNILKTGLRPLGTREKEQLYRAFSEIES